MLVNVTMPWRTHLFANYTQRMFERRSKITTCTREQILRWLAWLALSLMHNNLSVFYVEWMQPDWLPWRAQQLIVAIVDRSYCVDHDGRVVFRLVGALSGRLDRVAPAETLRWSWRVLVVGLIGLHRGGFAYLQHYLLRFLLWRNAYAPWNYIRFLDYAAERVFLRNVGGGYIFTHRLLMEYFTALQPTDQARQSMTA